MRWPRWFPRRPRRKAAPVPTPDPNEPNELLDYPQGIPDRLRCRWCKKTKSRVVGRPGLVCLECDYAPIIQQETT